jgi:hypothetical protein
VRWVGAVIRVRNVLGIEGPPTGDGNLRPMIALAVVVGGFAHGQPPNSNCYLRGRTGSRDRRGVRNNASWRGYNATGQ